MCVYVCFCRLCLLQYLYFKLDILPLLYLLEYLLILHMDKYILVIPSDNICYIQGAKIAKYWLKRLILYPIHLLNKEYLYKMTAKKLFIYSLVLG